ncbi:MAG: hypothetical protein ACE10G_12775, partial [Gemmatimonadales bacterium]
VSTCAPAPPDAESTRKEYDNALSYIHVNPFRRGTCGIIEADRIRFFFCCGRDDGSGGPPPNARERSG